MKTVIRKSTTLWPAALLAVAVLLVAFILSVGRVHADDGTSQTGRLITIHDRGVETTLLSDADTVQGALEDAGITVDKKDAVEPALDETLVAAEYNVNIYRARPVVIIDGGVRQKIVTPYQTGEQIAEDAGIDLRSEDRTILTRTNDIIANGAGLQLTVDRAVGVTLNLYGTNTKVYTQGETVGAMLIEKNIELEAKDRTSVPVRTPIREGMTVRVWREGKQTMTVEESVGFPVQQIQDADRELGYKTVKSKGKKGLRTVTYEIEIKNGKIVSRHEIASIVTKRPVKQIEIVGIKVELLANYSADKAAIMTAAGIAPSDQKYAAYIIDHENAAWCPIRWQGTPGCWAAYAEKFPGAEASNQVGYGLCQATPGNKMASAGADWRTNAVTQMKWCHGYAIGRYGSWEAAYQFKLLRGWW